MMHIQEDEPEWTAENINREDGSTTFETCGWCEHTGGGLGRYNCMITSTCTLLKGYGKPSKETENKWNTLCHLRKLGRADIRNLIEYQKLDIRQFKGRIEQAEENIISLQKLQSQLKDRPPLPNARSAEYHALGKTCYAFHKNEWCRGTIVTGYRTFDGCVSFVLDDYPESQPGKKGPWGCGVSVPHILLHWEFEYFQKHPDEFEQWLSLCDDKYNQDILDRTSLLEALKNFQPKKAISTDDDSSV